MVMDIMVAVIFVGAVFLSMHKGFALTVINFVRSIAALVLAFLFSDDLRDWLAEHTGLETWIQGKLTEYLGASLSSAWEDSDLYRIMPDLLQKQTASLANSFGEESAIQLTSTFMGILSFCLIVVAIGLAASVLNHLFSKQYNGGFFGFVDWLLGAAMGVVTGVIYVFVFLAVITPVTALFAPDISAGLANSLAESHVAGMLYDNNLLLLFFRDFLS